MELVIVSGCSGSGKSSALHALEDEGFYCIDNLPLSILPSLPEALKSIENEGLRVVVSIDIRNPPNSLHEFSNVIASMRTNKITCKVVYFKTAIDQLMLRYSTTGRKHPLSYKNISLRESIILEKELLQPIFQQADLKIDTTNFSIYQTKAFIKNKLCSNNNHKISIFLQSFGFKYGTPLDTNFLFDVRCLPNPFWIKELKSYTGLEEPVQQYLHGKSDVMQMTQDISDFIENWAPKFESLGRNYMMIAIGCTGGQHRSVYICKLLEDKFINSSRQIHTTHRELSGK